MTGRSDKVAPRTAETIPHQSARRRGRWRWLVLLAALAAVAWGLFAPPPAPAGGTRLAAFEPERLATLEQAAWEAYYERQWPRLSWAQALYAAYLNTQAQTIFARQGNQDGEAQAVMRRFYALVREPLGAHYDPERAAAAELRWWVVHRHRRDYPDSSELVRAFASLYAEVYSVPAAEVETAAQGRVRAVEASDRWLDEGRPAGSPLLTEVRNELLTGYTALKEALLRNHK